MDLLREYSKDKNEDTEEEFTDLNNKMSPILKLSKINSLMKPNKPADQNLVSHDEETQVNARKTYYEELEALGKDYKLKMCLTLTKVIVPITIVSLMALYWIIGLAKYFEII